MFECEIITTKEKLGDLEVAWNACLCDSLYDSVFLSHEWFNSWWECFGKTTGELFLVTMKRDGLLCGIFPLAMKDEYFHGLRVRKLVSPTNYHTPKFDFVLRGDPDELIEGLLNFLNNQLKWHVLELRYVPPESRTLSALKSLAARGKIIMKNETCMSSPYVTLNADFETYYHSLSRKFRQNTEYANRKLSEKGKVELEEIGNGARLLEDLKEGFEIERSGWKGESGTAVLDRPEEWQFYSRVASRAATKNWLRLFFVKVKDQRVAFDYCLAYRGIVSLVKIGYIASFGKYSPGNLLRSMVIKRLFDEQDVEYYDLLGTPSDWKLRWAHEISHLQEVHVFPGDARGRIMFEIEFGIKEKLKRILAVAKSAVFLKKHQRLT